MSSQTLAPQGANDSYMPDAGNTAGSTKEPGMLAICIAEFFGTFTLVIFGVGAALFGAKLSTIANAYQQDATTGGVKALPLPDAIAASAIQPLFYVTVIGVALSFGIGLIAAASSFGHISGAHVNPAVTFGLAAAGRMSWARVPAYVISQLLGGIAAGAVLLAVVSGTSIFTNTYQDATGKDVKGSIASVFQSVSNGYGDASMTGTTSLTTALIIEGVLTMFLAFVVLGSTEESRKMTSAPIAIGFTLTAMHIVAIPFTNCGVNPARSTATAVFAGFDSEAIKQLWVFWVAPIVGGLIAGLIYPIFSIYQKSNNLPAYELDGPQGGISGRLDSASKSARSTVAGAVQGGADIAKKAGGAVSDTVQGGVDAAKKAGETVADEVKDAFKRPE